MRIVVNVAALILTVIGPGRLESVRLANELDYAMGQCIKFLVVGSLKRIPTPRFANQP